MVHKKIVSEKRWSKFISSDAPCGRYGHRAIVHNDKMILHGGYNGTYRLNDTYEYDLERKAWREIEAKGEKPSERDCHSAVLYKGKMIIFGGGDGFNWLNDVWQYDIEEEVWQEIQTFGDIPMGRAGHSANIWKDKMYVFAGWNGRRTLMDLYELCLLTRVWRKVETNGTLPSSRDSHTSNIIGDVMIVVGGGDGRHRLNDMYQLNLKTQRWQKLECIGDTEAGRAGHVSVVFDDRLFIFGGGDGKNWLNDVYECDIKAPKWSLIDHIEDSSNTIAPGCYGLSAITYNNTMFIFGGGDGKEWYNNVYTYKLGDHKRKRHTLLKLNEHLVRNAFSDVEFVFDYLSEDSKCESELHLEKHNLSALRETRGEPQLFIGKLSTSTQETEIGEGGDTEHPRAESHSYSVYEEYLAMTSCDLNLFDDCIDE